MTELQNKKENYACPAARAETAAGLLAAAREAKKEKERRWRLLRSLCEETDSSSPEAGEKALVSAAVRFLAERKIDPVLPDFRFAEKEKTDAGVAALRTRLVHTVCRENNLSLCHLQNERRLGLFGSACYKLSLTENEEGEEQIVITNPSPEEIYPDPKGTSVEECDYIVHIYRAGAGTVFPLKEAGGFFPVIPSDSLITELWFRQPEDGTAEVAAFENGKRFLRRVAYHTGDIALLVFVNGREALYLPKFWQKTACACFPFVVYSRRPNDFSLWGQSDPEEAAVLFSALRKRENSPCLFPASPELRSEGNAFCLFSLLALFAEFSTGGEAAYAEYLRKREMAGRVCRDAGMTRLYTLVDRFILEFYDTNRLARIGEDAYSARECEDCMRFYGHAPTLDLILSDS